MGDVWIGNYWQLKYKTYRKFPKAQRKDMAPDFKSGKDLSSNVKEDIIKRRERHFGLRL